MVHNSFRHKRDRLVPISFSYAPKPLIYKAFRASPFICVLRRLFLSRGHIIP
nr:MAG TPA: hypothetical protein [Caudoviricetes sp.]